MNRPLLAVAASLLSACASPVTPNEPTQDWETPVLRTSLTIDLAAATGTASITLDGEGHTAASFDVGGIVVEAVRGGTTELDWELDAGRLDVALPVDSDTEIVIDYRFAEAAPFEGLMAGGSTLTWPYYCGNLFPCRPSPSEGATFGLTVSGAAQGEITVAADDSVGPAPAYQLAWATGPYTRVELGTTGQGTTVVVFAPEADQAAAEPGTQHLVAVLDWLELTLGAYPFGPETGPVRVQWPAGAVGGMEHHPYWHVAASAMNDPVVQAHEAAHAWFGDGVRLSCWEDLVLSEGLATYLAARATQVAVSPAAGAGVWADYTAELRSILSPGPMGRDLVARPEGCGAVDVLEDGLFGRAVYLKGAFFLRDVAREVGADALDAALGEFTRAHLGFPQTTADLLAAITEGTGFAPTALARDWLETLGAPDGWDAAP